MGDDGLEQGRFPWAHGARRTQAAQFGRARLIDAFRAAIARRKPRLMRMPVPGSGTGVALLSFRSKVVVVVPFQ